MNILKPKTLTGLLTIILCLQTSGQHPKDLLCFMKSPKT